MINHVVRFHLKPDAPEDKVRDVLDLMRRLGRENPAVEHFMVGRDFGGEFEVGALYALQDVDAYRTYMYDPLHRRIDAAGLPLVANMVSLDLTDDEDPEIGEKIAQVHKDRFSDHPELLDLVEDLDSYEGSGTSGGGATST
jgi:hypothetical protein